MGNVLEKACSDFISVARTTIEKRGTSRPKARMVYLDETVELRAKIDELEKTNEFQCLLDTTFSVFSADGYQVRVSHFGCLRLKIFFASQASTSISLRKRLEPGFSYWKICGGLSETTH
jgi:hypothetical protein